jgi:septal ring-binding cell division protein DamX
MRMWFRVAMCAALLGLAALPSPVVAQQKTVKACQDEWRANKADNQAKGITEKAYVAQCRAGGSSAQPTSEPAATPAPTSSAATTAPKKTVKACQDEWRANKPAYQAAKITEKAYVDKCRAGESVALPTAPTATPAPAPTTAAPPPTSAAKPSPTPATPPAGAGQFQSEVQAKSQCQTDLVVWVNLTSKIYHFAGNKNYGTTKAGAYMCEKEATAQGFRASKTEKRPSAGS